MKYMVVFDERFMLHLIQFWEVKYEKSYFEIIQVIPTKNRDFCCFRRFYLERMGATKKYAHLFSKLKI